MSKEEIISILMRRDKCTRLDAENLIEQCVTELHDATTITECEDIVAEWLGLEPDYLDVLLFE